MTGSYVAREGEAERLRRQVAGVWGHERELLVELGLGPGLRLLDIGCGPGATLQRIAADFAPAVAVGLDRERGHLLQAPRPVLCCDAAKLPLRDDSFDLALCRFMLRHVPDPARVLREAARVATRVLAVDADDLAWVLHPEPEGWRELSRALAESVRRRGGDPAMGRRLPHLLRECGLADVQARVQPITTDDVAAPAFVEMFLAPLARPVDADLLSPERAREAWDAVRAWSRRPDAFGWVVGVLASGRRG